MDASLLSIVVLVLLLLGAFVPRFSLALAALPAAFLVAAVAGVGLDELYGFFPVDFVVLIVGITALFVVIHATGTTDWLLSRALRPIGDRVVLVPLLLFAIGAFITAIGTLPAAATAIMAPITLGVASRRRLSPFLLCLASLSGILCGLFSPIAVFGATIPPLLSRAGVQVPSHASITLILASLAIGVVLALIAVLLIRRSVRVSVGRADAGPVADVEAPVEAPVDAVVKPSRLALWSSVTALVVLIVVGVVFTVNLGMLGLILALVLQMTLRLDPGPLIQRIPWEIVLLIGGLLTYVGLMDHLGALDRITAALTVEGSPMLSLLAICLIVGVTSFFASSIAVLATAVPLVAPLIQAGLSPVGAIVAVSLSAVVVDVNPLGITGGLLLGAAAPDDRARLFRNLLVYGLCAIVVGPLVVWAAFGWI